MKAGARVALLDLREEWLEESVADARAAGFEIASMAEDLEGRLAAAGAPAAWPQLGKQALRPRPEGGGTRA